MKHCSFYGKSHKEVENLIAEGGVSICNECAKSRRHGRVGVGPSESEPKAKLEVLGLPLREFPAIDEPKAMAEPQELAAGNKYE